MSDFIDRLGTELARAASTPLTPAPRPPLRLPLRTRPLAIVFAICLLAAAAAVAGTVLLRGAPVKPKQPPSPTLNEGAAAIAGTQLLPLHVADPAGGLPWGIRTVRTTRGDVCLQVGRLAYGTIGAVGVDGAFGNDHRFHPFSNNYLTQFQCTELDARGDAFGSFGTFGLPVSAVGMAEDVASTMGCLRRLAQRAVPCPAGDLRNVYFGLLGPDAASVTYVSHGGREITVPTVGSNGAYLIVTRWDARDRAQEIGSGYSGLHTLGSGSDPLRAISYRNGHACHVSSLYLCPNVGFVSGAARPAPSQLASTITIRKVAARSYCYSQTTNVIRPCDASVPSGFVRQAGGPPSELVEITFTARVAVRTARSYYYAAQFYRPSASCPEIAGSVSTSSNLGADQRVTLYSLEPVGCKVIHGVVRYRPDDAVGPGAEPDPVDRTAITVGRFTIHLP